jgi:hypothetical protein
VYPRLPAVTRPTLQRPVDWAAKHSPRGSRAADWLVRAGIGLAHGRSGGAGQRPGGRCTTPVPEPLLASGPTTAPLETATLARAMHLGVPSNPTLLQVFEGQIGDGSVLRPRKTEDEAEDDTEDGTETDE